MLITISSEKEKTFHFWQCKAVWQGYQENIQTCKCTDGNNTENSMPKAKSDEELAQKFADFFLENIQKIRKMFQDITPLQTQESDIPKIRSFSPMMESQVKKIIMEMQSKLCELDPIPTTLLKEVLHIVLPTNHKDSKFIFMPGWVLQFLENSHSASTFKEIRTWSHQ